MVGIIFAFSLARPIADTPRLLLAGRAELVAILFKDGCSSLNYLAGSIVSRLSSVGVPLVSSSLFFKALAWLTEEAVALVLFAF